MNFFARQLYALAKLAEDRAEKTHAAFLTSAAIEIESLERRLAAANAELDLPRLLMSRPRGGAVDLEKGSSDFYDDDVITIDEAFAADLDAQFAGHASEPATPLLS